MQLTIRDVEEILHVPEETIYRWIAEKQLPARQVNGRYHFSRLALLEWATANRIEVGPQALAEPDEVPPNLPRLDDALRVGGVHTNAAGDDPAAVLGGLLAELPLPDGFDRDGLLQMLLARGGLRATSIGDGVALPHPRFPVVLPGQPAAVALCFLGKPLAVATPDGKPIDTLFLLLSPTTRAHLQLLARLVFALRDPTFRDLIRRRAPAERLLPEAARLEEGFRAFTGSR